MTPEQLNKLAEEKYPMPVHAHYNYTQQDICQAERAAYISGLSKGLESGAGMNQQRAIQFEYDKVDHEGEREVMIQAFDKVRQIFEQRTWIMEGRGTYPCNDDRYREEVRNLYDEFDAIKKDTWQHISTKTADYRNKIISDYKASLSTPIQPQELPTETVKKVAVAYSDWLTEPHRISLTDIDGEPFDYWLKNVYKPEI